MVSAAIVAGAVAVIAVVALVVFRKRIGKAYLDSVVGGDSSRYDDADMDKVLAESEARIREVMK